MNINIISQSTNLRYFILCFWVVAAFAYVKPNYAQSETRVSSVNIDEAPTVSVADKEVAESIGSFRMPFDLSYAVDYPVEVVMSTRRNTAVNPEDFFGIGFSLTIPAGETRGTVWIGIVNDTLAEPTEDFSIRILKAVGANIAQDTAIITIKDDDANALPQFLLDIGLPVTESDGVAYATVKLLPPASEQTSVLISTSAGVSSPAEPGSDYYGIFQKLVFEAGEDEKQVPILIIDDQNVESRVEFLYVRLFSPSTNAGLIPFRNTTSIAIRDDDGDRP